MTETLADVILVHGLWMPGLVMAPLAARIAQAGYRTHLFDYPGRGQPLEAHAERLCAYARSRVGGGGNEKPVHFIGHSLGGLVTLAALHRADAPPVATVLLLGTPARGCLAGKRFARWPGGTWMMGHSETLWRGERADAWARWDGRAPLGVIAGSRPLSIGRLLGSLPGTNDGVVRLQETAVEGMRERIVLPVAHSAMLVSARVAAQSLHFLAHGRFAHES